MTIKLTEAQIEEQFQEVGEEQLQWDSSDELDITYKFDAHISNGWRREICLREGIRLYLDKHELSDQWNVDAGDRELSTFLMCFRLSGQEENVPATRFPKSEASSKNRKHSILSNGLRDNVKTIYADTEQHYRLHIDIPPEILRSFTSASNGELPKGLQHLIKSPDEAAYFREGDTQPLMNTVIQQILQCPYQGMVKRAYLESKTIELMALVFDHEIAIQQGEVKREVLKLEQLERVYYAKEILLRDLSNPPTLTELSQQVGLNAFTLGQHFRQVFGNTVFGQLQVYRLEAAKQLLAEQDIKVAAVARRVGYVSAASFTKAFKHRFGITPKGYQKICR